MIAAISERVARLPRGLVTALLMVMVTMLTSSMHVVIRMMTEDLHPFEVAFFRNFFGLAVLLPLMLRGGLHFPSTTRLPLHLLRTMFQLISMTTFFFGLSMIPLAKASALSFTAPLFATIFAVLILGERIRARRIAALLVGFCGMLVIVRPSASTIDAGSLLVLVSAATLAGMLLCIKKLSATESSVNITTIAAFMMTFVSLFPALTVWQWPTIEQLGWMLAIGAMGSMAHVLVAQAMRRADATEVLPYDFTRLLWASLLGLVVFAEIPEWWTIAGGAIIFVSTVYIAYRESRVSRSALAAASVGERG